MPHESHQPFIDLILSLSNKWKKRHVIDYLDGDRNDETLALCFEQWSYGNSGAVANILDSTNKSVRVLKKEGALQEYKVVENPHYDPKAEAKAVPA
jgi:hypothetical protein